jgi:hypothetical protein
VGDAVHEEDVVREGLLEGLDRHDHTVHDRSEVLSRLVRLLGAGPLATALFVVHALGGRVRVRPRPPAAGSQRPLRRGGSVARPRGRVLAVGAGELVHPGPDLPVAPRGLPGGMELRDTRPDLRRPRGGAQPGRPAGGAGRGAGGRVAGRPAGWAPVLPPGPSAVPPRAPTSAPPYAPPGAPAHRLGAEAPTAGLFGRAQQGAAGWPGRPGAASGAGGEGRAVVHTYLSQAAARQGMIFWYMLSHMRLHAVSRPGHRVHLQRSEELITRLEEQTLAVQRIALGNARRSPGLRASTGLMPSPAATSLALASSDFARRRRT